MNLAGLETICIGTDISHEKLVILLHGYAMAATDLAPFGRSLGVPALFLFPQGPHTGHPAGRAWWSIDTRMRSAALTEGPRDLTDKCPSGLIAAREQLNQYIQVCRLRFKPRKLIVGGFSQGGMLACDWLLHCERPADALVVLSASRLNFAAWESRRNRMQDLPVLVSHGRQDQDLSFQAGERLRDFAIDAKADVTWVPFDGGHEIPLPVWRSVREFLRTNIL